MPSLFIGKAVCWTRVAAGPCPSVDIRHAIAIGVGECNTPCASAAESQEPLMPTEVQAAVSSNAFDPPA